MTPEQDNSMAMPTDSDHKQQVETIEASWAPADPRDRLYDADASGSEKSVSLFRIIAAFHPVLNLPVLLYDLARRIGTGYFLMIVGFLLTAALLYFFR